MHDLGIAVILGIEVTRDHANQKMYLSQRKHIKDVDRFNMANARPVLTLTKEDCPQIT